MRVRMTILKEEVPFRGLGILPWSTFHLATRDHSDISLILSAICSNRGFLVDLQPCDTTLEKRLCGLKIDGSSLGLALLAAAHACERGLRLVDLVASAAVALDGNSEAVLEGVTGLKAKFDAKGALPHWIEEAHSNPAIVVVGRAPQGAGHLSAAIGTWTAMPARKEKLKRFLITRKEGDPFKSLQTHLVVLDSGLKKHLERVRDLGFATTEALAEDDNTYLQRVLNRLEDLKPKAREYVPVPFNSDPAAWARRFAQGLAKAALEDTNHTKPIPVVFSARDVLDRPWKPIHVRIAEVLSACISANNQDSSVDLQVVRNRLFCQRGYGFVIHGGGSIAGRRDAKSADDLLEAVEALGMPPLHPVVVVASDVHQLLELEDA